MTPLMRMHTLGHDFIPPGIHAGGLRYHGMAPLISLLHDEGIIEAQAYYQNAVFEAAVQFARAEGIVPAPEAGHAVRAAINEALKAKEAGGGKGIFFNLRWHAHFPISASSAHLSLHTSTSALPPE